MSIDTKIKTAARSLPRVRRSATEDEPLATIEVA